jgi:hypothetical protein
MHGASQMTWILFSQYLQKADLDQMQLVMVDRVFDFVNDIARLDDDDY